jgi:hypothetical protein
MSVVRGNALPYARAIGNLFLNAETRVMYQGFTGKQVTPQAALLD